VKINLVELIVREEQKKTAPGDRFVLWGYARRTPQLDAAGFVVLERLLVTCCFADAVAVGVVVKVDDPGRFKDGEWVRVAGRVSPFPADMPKTAYNAPGAMAAQLCEAFILDADSAEADGAPDLPFIFDVRDEEPLPIDVNFPHRRAYSVGRGRPCWRRKVSLSQ